MGACGSKAMSKSQDPPENPGVMSQGKVPPNASAPPMNQKGYGGQQDYPSVNHAPPQYPPAEYANQTSYPQQASYTSPGPSPQGAYPPQGQAYPPQQPQPSPQNHPQQSQEPQQSQGGSNAGAAALGVLGGVAIGAMVAGRHRPVPVVVRPVPVVVGPRLGPRVGRPVVGSVRVTRRRF